MYPVCCSSVEEPFRYLLVSVGVGHLVEVLFLLALSGTSFQTDCEFMFWVN